MGIQDIIVILIILAIFAGIVFYLKSKKNNVCAGCSACNSGNKSSCDIKNK